MFELNTVQQLLKKIVRSRMTHAPEVKALFKIYQGRNVWSKLLKQKEILSLQWRDEELSQKERELKRQQLKNVLQRQQTLFTLFCQAVPKGIAALNIPADTQEFPKKTREFMRDAALAAQSLLIEFFKQEISLKEIIDEEIASVNAKKSSSYFLLHEEEVQRIQQIVQTCNAILEDAQKEQEDYWQTVIEAVLAGGGAATHFMAGQMLFGLFLAFMALGLLRWLVIARKE